MSTALLPLNNYHSCTIAPPTSGGLLHAFAPKTTEQVVDVILQHTLVGVMAQLAQLSGYANQAFSNVLQDTTHLTTRIASVSNRCAQLIERVPTLEHHHAFVSVEEMNSTSKIESHGSVDGGEAKHQYFTSDAMPLHVKQQYERCRPPPNLSILDPCMDSGRKAGRLYSDPQYFVEEWIAEQRKLQVTHSEHREARLKRKQDALLAGQNTATLHTKLHKLKKPVYCGVTGSILKVDDHTAPSSSSVRYVPPVVTPVVRVTQPVVVNPNVYWATSKPTSFAEPSTLVYTSSANLNPNPTPDSDSIPDFPLLPQPDQVMYYQKPEVHASTQDSSVLVDGVGLPSPPPPAAPLHSTPQRVKPVDTHSALLKSIQEGRSLKPVGPLQKTKPCDPFSSLIEDYFRPKIDVSDSSEESTSSEDDEMWL